MTAIPDWYKLPGLSAVSVSFQAQVVAVQGSDATRHGLCRPLDPEEPILKCECGRWSLDVSIGHG